MRCFQLKATPSAALVHFAAGGNILDFATDPAATMANSCHVEHCRTGRHQILSGALQVTNHQCPCENAFPRRQMSATLL